jgi:hypothetical protein
MRRVGAGKVCLAPDQPQRGPAGVFERRADVSENVLAIADLARDVQFIRRERASVQFLRLVPNLV